MGEIDEAYDDNTRNTPTDAKGDFLTAELLGATLGADSARRAFSLSYTALMVENASYSNQTKLGQNHYLSLSDVEQLSKDTSLKLSNTFLMGDAVGGFLLANGSTPIGSQLLSSMLYHNALLSNAFDLTLKSQYSENVDWSGGIHQVYFSTLTNSSAVAAPLGAPSTGDSFDQGGALNADYNLGGRFTAGAGLTFDDFRFSNGKLPTTDAYWPQARGGWGVGTPFSLTGAIGPIIARSSSGVVGTTVQSAQTKVTVGYLLTGSYKSRRLLCSLTAGQIPNTTAGLGAYSTSQIYGVLAQYNLTRRLIAFANFGYLSFNGTGISTNLVTYTAGISYRLDRVFTVNAQYLGFQEIGGSVGPVAVTGLAAGDTVTNLFEIGVIVTPRPFRWRD